MKKNIYIFLIILSSCSSMNSERQEGTQFDRGATSVNENDTVFVRLTPKIAFNWNNKTSSIIEDRWYELTKESYLMERQVVFNQISNIKETPAKMCDVERRLVLGDLAYLVVDKFERIPWSSVFKVQFDYSTFGCDYPLGLIDYIKDNRKKAIDQMTQYLEQQGRL